MASKTTFLSVTNTEPRAGDLYCTVIPKDELWIHTLVLTPIPGLGAPDGNVYPGNPPVGCQRCINLNASNSVFTTPAPFTLGITYDDGTYDVSDVQVVDAVAALVAGLIGSVQQGVLSMSPNDRAVFVTQVLKLNAQPPAAQFARTLKPMITPLLHNGRQGDQLEGKSEKPRAPSDPL